MAATKSHRFLDYVFKIIKNVIKACELDGEYRHEKSGEDTKITCHRFIVTVPIHFLFKIYYISFLRLL